MTDEVDRLRRVAYGPGSSARARAEAEAALLELERARRVRAGDTTSDATEHLPVVTDAPETPVGPTVPEEPGPRQDSGIRPLWLIPVVAASLALGALGALSATGQFADAPSAAGPSGQPRPLSSDGPIATQFPIGDLAAADRNFTREFAPEDAFPNPSLLTASSVETDNTRLLEATTADGTAITVWAGTSRLGYLCLLATVSPEDGGAISCSSRADFAHGGGLGFGVDGYLVSWDGDDVSIDRIAG